MFAEEALWLRGRIDALPRSVLDVLDIGSQNIEFRTTIQPWIDADVHAPLRSRGATIVNLDAQDAPGVDVTADVTDPAFDPASVGQFDLVLCCNLLEHVTDRHATISNLRDLVRPSGSLAVTVPHRFPYHEDPIDTMYRPSPRSLLRDIQAVEPTFTCVASGIVSCRSRSYYQSRKSRLRLLAPPLRWQTSCLVVTREPRVNG